VSSESASSAMLNHLLRKIEAMRQANKALAQEMRAFKVYHAKDLEQVSLWADRLDP
jgi:hypothetical protein